MRGCGNFQAVNKQLMAINQFDIKVLLLIQTWRRPCLNQFFRIVTNTGTGKAWFIFALVTTILNQQGVQFTSHQQEYMKALISPLFAWILSSLIKRTIFRARPSSLIEGYEKISPAPACSSFPSGHTSAAFSFFISLYLYQHPWSYIFGIWAALIAFSRMYLGVHYFSDVVGGLVLGSLSGIYFRNL
jgi:undecaprenyl-diphosphatase